MFYQIKRMLVKEGFSSNIIDRFAKPGMLIEQQPGFIDKQVLQKKDRRGDEELMVVIRWESERLGRTGRSVPTISLVTRQMQTNRNLIMF